MECDCGGGHFLQFRPLTGCTVRLGAGQFYCRLLPAEDVGWDEPYDIALEFTVRPRVVSRQKMSSICQEELLLTQELFILPFSINVL